MNQDTVKILFALLRSAIRGNQLQETEKEFLSDDVLKELYGIAKKHDVAHLFASGLDKNGLLSKDNQKISNEIIMAIYRYTQLTYEYERLCDHLETSNFLFIPLKGSVLRKYYPEPWMRTSCDIDILVHENEVEKIYSCLIRDYGYSYMGKGSHDISLFSPNKIHLELHYNLVEDGLINNSSDVLKSVWEISTVKKQHGFLLEMPDEMFYFYHIAHMAKHFQNGGCGIRFFIDLWILDNIDGVDVNKRNEMLERGDLLKFAKVVRLLSQVWFEEKQHTEITKQMELFILRGGIYGISENRIDIHVQKEGGRFNYIFSRIFMPYNDIKFQYPILQKHRWLTPIMEVRRWFRLIFCGRGKWAMKELKYSKSLKSTDATNMQMFLNNIGL